MSSTRDMRTIYEIFRACRLCGAGGGYKMPIIQNIIPFDFMHIELREKIRECVQIEVKEDDKMPPLICELCVDKVNDFYDFLELCRQTNMETRLRLGLPTLVKSQGPSDDCILGVTETVFSNDQDQPQQRSRPCPKSKKNVFQVKKQDVKVDTPKSGKEKKNQGSAMSKSLAKELDNLKNLEQKSKSDSPRTSRKRDPVIYVDSRSSSVSGRSSPIPAKGTRRKISVEQSETPRTSSSARDTRRSANDDMTLGKIKQLEQQKQAAKTLPKKGKDVKVEVPSDSDNDEALSSRRGKRSGDKGTPKAEVSLKRIKEISSDSDNDEALSSKRAKRGRDKDTPKAEVSLKRIKLTIKLPPKPKIPTLGLNECPACGFIASTQAGSTNHILWKHPVTYTSPELACNPCGEWFATAEEAETHHNKHSKYKCRHCKKEYKHLATYNDHFERNSCRPFEEVPDVQCQTCWAFFPTANLMKQHKCPGTGSRPGGACKKCFKLFTTLKTLKRHEGQCTSRSKDTKPAKTEQSKPAKNEISKPTKNDNSKPAKNETSKPAKKETSKSVKSEAPKSGPKSARGAVRISSKIRSQLRPAAVRVAKCDPLLRKRRSRSGKYDVTDVPHEIQQELYREEDYVHWDSDISSDSDNDIEQFGEKRRKVPTLTALSLKTVFSKRCLGKVPRKLRKVKQDKLFDSLFNNTADDDLSGDINNIIDNLSKEDSISVNLLNVGINYESDSVLDNSILGGVDGIDVVINDVNKNSSVFDVSASAETKTNDKNDLESKNNFNDDDTDASMNDTIDDLNDESRNTNSGVNKENDKNDDKSDKTDDLSSRNSEQDEEFNSTAVDNNENKKDIEKEDRNTNIERANVNETQSKNDFEVETNQNREENKESNVENKESYAKNEETYKNGDFLNGISDKSDNFDSEIDDNKLMEDLDAQIGESEMKDTCSNFSIDNLIDKSMPQSFGLGSIGDEEFL